MTESACSTSCGDPSLDCVAPETCLPTRHFPVNEHVDAEAAKSQATTAVPEHGPRSSLDLPQVWQQMTQIGHWTAGPIRPFAFG